MNWGLVSAILDGIGAMAVIISLVYLGIQVRIQNEERRIASVHEICEAYRNTLSSLHEPILACLFMRANEGYDKLDPTERLQVMSYCMVALKLFEEAFYQRQQKRLDEHIWEGMATQLADSMSTEALRSVWNQRRHQFGREFRSFMDSLREGKYIV
jgi:hypothetical protein